MKQQRNTIIMTTGDMRNMELGGTLREGMRFFGGLLVVLSLLLIGCQPKPAVDQGGPNGAAAHSDHDGDQEAPYAAAIAEAMAELSEEDRALAEQQKICPVSMEPLGSMGVPMKVPVDGKEVFICCEGCTTPLQEDPEKYLANLKE